MFLVNVWEGSGQLIKYTYSDGDRNVLRRTVDVGRRSRDEGSLVLGGAGALRRRRRIVGVLATTAGQSSDHGAGRWSVVSRFG